MELKTVKIEKPADLRNTRPTRFILHLFDVFLAVPRNADDAVFQAQVAKRLRQTGGQRDDPRAFLRGTPHDFRLAAKPIPQRKTAGKDRQDGYGKEQTVCHTERPRDRRKTAWGTGEPNLL